MKLFKKIAMCMMCLVFVVPMLAACGGGGGLEAFDKEGNRTLKIMVHVSKTSEEGVAYQKRVDAFNEYYRGEKIKAQLECKPRSAGAAGYETELTNMMNGGNMPDVITFDAPKAWSYAGTYLAPMDDYISKETVNDIPEVSRNYGADGKLYGLPIQESSAGIFYNKAILRDAGVLEEVQQYTVDNPWTFEQFKEVCRKIKDSGRLKEDEFPVDMRLYSTEDEMATYLLYPFIMTSGGQMLSDNGQTASGYLNSAASVKGFQFLKDLANSGYTSYSIDKDGFFTGKHAMYLSSGWTIPQIKTKYRQTFPTDDSWGILPYPKGDAAAVSPTASWSFGMANIDRGDKESVIKLIEWMVTPESSLAITSATGMIPARKSVVESNPYAAGSPEKMLYDQLMKTGKKRPETAAYSDFSTAFANIIIELKTENDVKKAVDAKTSSLQSNLDLFFS